MTDPNMMDEWEFKQELEKEAEKGTVELVKFMAFRQFHQEVLCHSMNKHMADTNGSVKELWREIELGRQERESIRQDVERKSLDAKDKFNILKDNQEKLPDRMWLQLPWKWKYSVVLIILLLLANVIVEGFADKVI